MPSMRDIGYKMFSLASEQGKFEPLRNALGYSPIDMHRLFEGRLVVSADDFNKIFRILNISEDELVSHVEEKAYPLMIHCMSDFTKKEHCDKILDIIDSYIDFRESVAI